uniref:Prolactin receptor n=1 Tax=Romanomermis culicivorax TaxID=13658 RepID=A0A915JN00_ROMCU
LEVEDNSKVCPRPRLDLVPDLPTLPELVRYPAQICLPPAAKMPSTTMVGQIAEGGAKKEKRRREVAEISERRTLSQPIGKSKDNSQNIEQRNANEDKMGIAVEDSCEPPIKQWENSAHFVDLVKNDKDPKSIGQSIALVPNQE